MAQYAALAHHGDSASVQFSIAEKLGPAVNSPDIEWLPRLSNDGLSLHFTRNYETEAKGWIAKRATTQDPWCLAVHLEGASVSKRVTSVGVVPGETTGDGLEFYFSDIRPGSYGYSDIYVMMREAIDSPWTEPVNLGAVVNSAYYEITPSISPNGLELYFSDYIPELARPGGHGGGDLWVTRRLTRGDPWQEPENLGPQVNSPAQDARLHISSDGLLLFFDSERPGGYGGQDLYVTRRATLGDPWGEAENLGPCVNSPATEYDPGISPDGRMLYFVRDNDIWQAPVICAASNSDPNNAVRLLDQPKQSDSKRR